MFLAALALQAEFGDYIPEVKYSVALKLFVHSGNWKAIRKSTLVPPGRTVYLAVTLLILSRFMERTTSRWNTTFQKESWKKWPCPL